MPEFLMNRTFITAVTVIAAVIITVFLYKTLRLIAERVAYYGTVKKICKIKNGTLKRNGPLLRSVFRAYPGYDIELTAGGRRYGVKFFPKYLKNKNLLIESVTRACLLKNTGVMGITRRGSLPGARTMTPDVIHEVIGRTLKVDLTGADADVSILIFSPGCKRIYYVNKTARAEAYNGDDVFGYKVFYKKDSLAAFLEKQ